MIFKQFLLVFFVIAGGNFLTVAKADDGLPHQRGLLSSINVGVRYSSLLEHRGVIFYRDFQIDPVVGVFLFDDKLEFLGDSLSYRDFIAGKWLRLRGKIASITDKPLFPDHASVREGNPDRKNTTELSLRTEFFVPAYNDDYQAEIDFGYAKDIEAHQGQYFDLQTKIKLFDYTIPIFHTFIEPQLFASIGWGDGKHNKYLYGPSVGLDGLTNYSVGFWISFPKEADRFFPIIQGRYFESLGVFKDGELAQQRNKGFLFSFIATGGIL